MPDTPYSFGCEATDWRRGIWSPCNRLVCPACDMPSFAPCLHEEVGTRIFAHATEAAKRPNKKISSCAVYTAIVVLVIPVVQQL